MSALKSFSLYEIFFLSQECSKCKKVAPSYDSATSYNIMTTVEGEFWKNQHVSL